jgi:hypothetical protein
MSITLPKVKHQPRAIIKQGAYRARERAVGGPDGLLATLTPFSSGGAMHAHRYNDADHNLSAPPASGGKMPREYTIPATAVYVVFSYVTPIAWVDADGTVTIPDTRYSPTTTQHQGQCRAWLGSKVEGIKR